MAPLLFKWSNTWQVLLSSEQVVGINTAASFSTLKMNINLSFCSESKTHGTRIVADKTQSGGERRRSIWVFPNVSVSGNRWGVHVRRWTLSSRRSFESRVTKWSLSFRKFRSSTRIITTVGLYVCNVCKQPLIWVYCIFIIANLTVECLSAKLMLEELTELPCLTSWE